MPLPGHNRIELVDRWKRLRVSPIGVDYVVKDHEIVGPGVFRRKLVLVGAGHTQQYVTDFLDDPAYEVWTINAVAPIDRYRQARADRWFDLHQRIAQSEADLRWIRECPFPIYVPEDLIDEGPNTVRYPLAAIEERYGGYWACSFAYQIALALSEGFTDIAIGGIDLHYGDARERTVEYANTSWWLGYADAKGITLHLPAASRLGQHEYRYGIEYTEEKLATEQYVREVEICDARRLHRKLMAQWIEAAGDAHGSIKNDAIDEIDQVPSGVGG